MTPPDALAVVVVTHDSAAHLPELLGALLEQLDPDDELVVVDNASSDDSVAAARNAGARVRVLETGANLGFGAGCHAGARETSAALLLFLNPDCQPEPGCFAQLRAAASERPSWGAWQATVLLPDGRINTDGGVIHYLGIGWAGDCGKPLNAMPPGPREVAFPSGAALVVRRSAWDHLGGFDPTYFMYSEDLDLGLRLWLAGYSAGIVPDARVVHSYEFEKGPSKWFWLERNRWRTVMSVYPLPLLLVLAPALAGTELALLVVAALDGWLPAKLRAQAAGVAGLPRTLRRRRAIQATRSVTAREFATHLTASLDSPYLRIGATGWVFWAQSIYWQGVKRLLAVTAR